MDDAGVPVRPWCPPAAVRQTADLDDLLDGGADRGRQRMTLRHIADSGLVREAVALDPEEPDLATEVVAEAQPLLNCFLRASSVSSARRCASAFDWIASAACSSRFEISSDTIYRSKIVHLDVPDVLSWGMLEVAARGAIRGANPSILRILQGCGNTDRMNKFKTLSPKLSPNP